nr:acylphosphatase [Bacteroidota bacterium]
MLKHYHIEIRGKVNRQGYKLHTMILANRHAIHGNVAERVNRIEIEAEGEKANLEGFVAFCKKELAGSKIESIILEEKPLAYYDEFTIL